MGSGEDGGVPPNATLQINLELISWKIVSEVTNDKKVLKRILKEGEGYERPNDSALVKGTKKLNYLVIASQIDIYDYPSVLICFFLQ